MILGIIIIGIVIWICLLVHRDATQEERNEKIELKVREACASKEPSYIKDSLITVFDEPDYFSSDEIINSKISMMQSMDEREQSESFLNRFLTTIYYIASSIIILIILVCIIFVSF